MIFRTASLNSIPQTTQQSHLEVSNPARDLVTRNIDPLTPLRPTAELANLRAVVCVHVPKDAPVDRPLDELVPAPEPLVTAVKVNVVVDLHKVSDVVDVGRPCKDDPDSEERETCGDEVSLRQEGIAKAAGARGEMYPRREIFLVGLHDASLFLHQHIICFQLYSFLVARECCVLE